MKILLINPSLFQATTGQYEETLEKERGVYPPMGLAYIAATLEEAGHEVKIIDCDVTDDYRAVIKEECLKNQPQLVGFYAMTWNYPLAKNIAEEIRRILPKTTIILGGPNVTTMPKQSLTMGCFDFGIMGEGEKTIVELIEKIENKNDSDWDRILGLAFKRDDQIIINEARPLINDLDSIPFPARHLLPMDKYSDVFTKNKNFTTIFATRGCPFNCTFCDRKNRMGKNWRFRSPHNIIEEIRQVKDRYGIKEFMFFDDNLIVNKDWAYELMEGLKKINIIWECRERVDMVDEAMLKAMKEAGCYRIRFGFESGDNETLKRIHKGITVEQSLACAKICKKIGIEIFGYYIIGAPQETEESINKTIELALKINPAFALFSKMILIPGSEIFQYAVKTGQISPDYWEKFLVGEITNGAPSFNKELVPEKLVDEYIKRAEHKFYMRPSFILKQLLRTKSFNHLLKQIKLGLAIIFKRNSKCND